MAQAARKSDGVAKSARSAKTTAKGVRTSRIATKSKQIAGDRQSSRAEGSSSQIPAEGMIGDIRIAAGPAFSAAARLRVTGMNTAHEKEKLSVTLDKSIVEEIRALSGGRPMSTSINVLLRDALAQHRLGELVAEMEETSGPVTAEAYERVFSQWFEEE
jgi:uncharacterized protein (DUF4415 family)